MTIYEMIDFFAYNSASLEDITNKVVIYSLDESEIIAEYDSFKDAAYGDYSDTECVSFDVMQDKDNEYGLILELNI